MPLEQAIAAFQRFCGQDLTRTLAQIESSLGGTSRESLDGTLTSIGASAEMLMGAGELKRILGQLNVVIHALGILLCLPKILEPGEVIQYVSLGAGNTGRPFDLETDRRVAEFKFITWQGGSEPIRQNGVFKDFYLLAEHNTQKKKYLYVLGTLYPLKFLNGGRALVSVLSKDAPLLKQFQGKYGNHYHKVREYYQPRQAAVLIEDASPWLSSLVPSEGDEVETVV